jgi:hypothetical protein
MNRTSHRFVALIAILLGSPAILADEPELAANPQTETEKPLQTSENEQLVALRGKLAAVEEVIEGHKSELGKLSKLKFSGFLQPRFEWHQNSVNGIGKDGKPGEKTYFYVRRVRLITAYSGKNAEFLFSFDGGQNALAVKDIESTFVDTFTPLNLRITLGQFKIPFGHEVVLSDSAREMPERALMIQKLFPGERDRGLRVQGHYEILRFVLALVNGNGSTTDPIFSYKDTNSYKDLVGRIGIDLDHFAVGFSGWYGLASVYNPASTTSTDVLGLKKYERFRGGIDTQAYIDVPEVGGLALKGELMYSRDKNQAYNGLAADHCQDRIGYGVSLTAAQTIGEYLGVAVRFDTFDPLLQGQLDGCSTTTAASIDRISTLGGALLVHASPNLRTTLAYEHPFEQGKNKQDNDLFTLQLQTKF